jgi:hypothetical protein
MATMDIKSELAQKRMGPYWKWFASVEEWPRWKAAMMETGGDARHAMHWILNRSSQLRATTFPLTEADIVGSAAQSYIPIERMEGAFETLAKRLTVNTENQPWLVWDRVDGTLTLYRFDPFQDRYWDELKREAKAAAAADRAAKRKRPGPVSSQSFSPPAHRPNVAFVSNTELDQRERAAEDAKAPPKPVLDAFAATLRSRLQEAIDHRNVDRNGNGSDGVKCSEYERNMDGIDGMDARMRAECVQKANRNPVSRPGIDGPAWCGYVQKAGRNRTECEQSLLEDHRASSQELDSGLGLRVGTVVSGGGAGGVELGTHQESTTTTKNRSEGQGEEPEAGGQAKGEEEEEETRTEEATVQNMDRNRTETGEQHDGNVESVGERSLAAEREAMLAAPGKWAEWVRTWFVAIEARCGGAWGEMYGVVGGMDVAQSLANCREWALTHPMEVMDLSRPAKDRLRGLVRKWLAKDAADHSRPAVADAEMRAARGSGAKVVGKSVRCGQCGQETYRDDLGGEAGTACPRCGAEAIERVKK